MAAVARAYPQLAGYAHWRKGKLFVERGQWIEALAAFGQLRGGEDRLAELARAEARQVRIMLMGELDRELREILALQQEIRRHTRMLATAHIANESKQ
jgi:hypothetical protein